MSRRVSLADFMGEDDRNISAILSDDESEYQRRRTETKRILLKIINNELTPRQKEIIMLYYFQERNISEIGEMLGVSPASVSVTLKRAKNRVIKYMKYYF